MAHAEVPRYNQFLWPTVEALRELGGSGAIDEVNETVVRQQGYSEEQQAVMHGDGPGTELAYRLAWARTYLKGMGLATNSERGVWSLTEFGGRVTVDEIEPLRRRFAAENRARSKGKQDAEANELPEDAWQDLLLDRVMRLTPAGFERLAQRLLREAGFINTQVTGRSGDGGIDGTGVYRLSLVSFPVYFQCKRYKGSVGAAAVRDFRGAMVGRGDKGMLITTGTFTGEAKAEATRDGAPPIDLIDGARLADLLKEYGLGVEVTTRTVEEVHVIDGFFNQEFQ